MIGAPGHDAWAVDDLPCVVIDHQETILTDLALPRQFGRARPGVAQMG